MPQEIRQHNKKAKRHPASSRLEWKQLNTINSIRKHGQAGCEPPPAVATPAPSGRRPDPQKNPVWEPIHSSHSSVSLSQATRLLYKHTAEHNNDFLISKLIWLKAGKKLLSQKLSDYGVRNCLVVYYERSSATVHGKDFIATQILLFIHPNYTSTNTSVQG